MDRTLWLVRRWRFIPLWVVPDLEITLQQAFSYEFDAKNGKSEGKMFWSHVDTRLEIFLHKVHDEQTLYVDGCHLITKK